VTRTIQDPAIDFDAMTPAERQKHFDCLGTEQILTEAIRWLDWLLN
jgi:hypothetical protein